MQIQLTVKDMILNARQQEWVERRLQFALGRFATRIRRVAVAFSDINGVRGGLDKKCRLSISLNPGSEVVVQDVDASVEAVVSNAADRAARSVARALDRMREGRFSATAPVADLPPAPARAPKTAAPEKSSKPAGRPRASRQRRGD